LKIKIEGYFYHFIYTTQWQIILPPSRLNDKLGRVKSSLIDLEAEIANKAQAVFTL